MIYRVVCSYEGEFDLERDQQLRDITHQTLGFHLAFMTPEPDPFDDKVLNVWELEVQSQAEALMQALRTLGYDRHHLRLEEE